MGAATFFVCAIFSATAFGGRPGPPGRHFPRALRRRRRPFFSFGFAVPVEIPPRSDWIAERTSCCTRSRITVTRLRCLGISPPFGAASVSGFEILQGEVIGDAEECLLRDHLLAVHLRTVQPETLSVLLRLFVVTEPAPASS